MIRAVGVVLTLVAIYGVLVAAVYLGQRGLLFHPDDERGTPAAAGLPDMTEVTFPTEDGLTLAAWRASAADGAPTVVYFHGNGGSIGGRAKKARPFLAAGYGLLMVEYRGYGGNPGRPSEVGLYADARAALDYLAGQGLPSGALILYGESLGSGIAVRMATERAVAAVILESPYTSIVDVAAGVYWYLPVRLLARDRFPSIDRIAAIGAPLLIVHGEQDRTVPPSHGRAMLAAARDPKRGVFLPAAGHNDLFDHGADKIIVEWLLRGGRS